MPEVSEIKKLDVSSSAFEHKGFIPSKYTCNGENINPPIYIGFLPANCKSLVVIIEDPDAPAGTWIHWLIWNIPPTYKIQENTKPGIEGKNSNGHHKYEGPCPPSGTHRYFFKVYALDILLTLKTESNAIKVKEAIKDHILGYGECMGYYKQIKDS